MSLFSILTLKEKSLCEMAASNPEILSENDDLYNKLYDHYVSTGEMPYSAQKARDEDPLSWIATQIEKEFLKYH